MRRAMMVSLVTLLCGVPSLLAQTGTISGTVVDVQSGRPLASAVVTVAGSRWSAMTGVEGRFVISGVTPGTYAARAALIGYGPQEQTVTVTAGGAATAAFRLSVSAVTLE